MTQPDESKIEYVAEPVDVDAGSVPSDLGYDADTEQLLDSGVLDVRKVTPKSAAEQFGLNDEEFRQGRDSLIRIDYETWSAAKKFNPELPEQVIYRREHLYMKHSDLLVDDFANHGMGTNFETYGFENDDYKEGSPDDVHLTPDARDSLQREIESEHRWSIAELLDGDVANIPAGLGEVMQALYEEIAEETRQEQNDAE
jgi:hypothetical protein